MDETTLSPVVRSRVDYRMRRHALLRRVAEGQVRLDEVTDAHPDLLRAAGHLGADVGQACPLCDAAMVQVTYVFDDDRRRHPGGRALAPAQLKRELARWGELEACVVEVCRACHWHHLLERSVLAARGSGAHTG